MLYRQAVINYICKAKNRLLDMAATNQSVINDTLPINIKRIVYIAVAAIPVGLLHIAVFSANLTQAKGNEFTWRVGIILSHTSLVIVMGILLILSLYVIKRKKFHTMAKILSITIILFILSIGVIIVSIDQLVTSNITPYLIACTVSAAAILIRPFLMMCIYLFSFAVYYYAISVTQLDQTLLLTNRVNGITAAVLGIFTSYIFWKAAVYNIVQNRLVIAQREELQKKNQELQFLAYYDQLTLLHNRKSFEEILNNEIIKIRGFRYESCVILFDIDYFKDINDRYGHPAGDKCLIQLATVLKENLRRTDVVARWGGEEFIILLPDTSIEAGMLYAGKIKKIIADTVFLVNEGNARLTASFGVTSLKANDCLQSDKIYSEVDNALYLAKKCGRNCVVKADGKKI